LKDQLRAADPQIVARMDGNRQRLLDALVRYMAERVGRPSEREESYAASDWPSVPVPDVEITHEQLAEWLETYPNHPDLLRLAVERAIGMVEAPGLDLVPLLEQYAEARPVDPLPHRYLALIWQREGDAERAIPHLEYLDDREQYTNVYATALARFYRDLGRFDAALAKANRAVNINAYDAPNRELAAAIAVQAGDLPMARRHIVALTILEPDRPQHQSRLQAIDRLIAERSDG
jgi:tetratricopeptide (TPR) repeat protein